MKQLNEIGNACRFHCGAWVCSDKGDGCRHRQGGSVCIFKRGDYCTCARAMADAYSLLKQIHEEVIKETRFDRYIAGTDNKKRPTYFQWLRGIGIGGAE